MIKLVVIGLFAICFASFAWGMLCFFRVRHSVGWRARLVGVTGSLMIALHLVCLISVDVDLAARTCAAVLLYFSSLALFWASVAVHRLNPPSFCFSSDSPTKLVTSGPYQWVRHPFYSAYMLAWLAGVFAVGRPWLLSSFLVMTILYVLAASLEERAFELSVVGREFDQYKSRTGMFLPKLSRICRP